MEIIFKKSEIQLTSLSDDLTEEELLALEKSAKDLENLLARVRSLLAYGIFALLFLVIVQAALTVTLTLPVYYKVDPKR